jgi:hypothetical protein
MTETTRSVKSANSVNPATTEEVAVSAAAVIATEPKLETPRLNDKIPKRMKLAPEKCSTDGEMVTL